MFPQHPRPLNNIFLSVRSAATIILRKCNGPPPVRGKPCATTTKISRPKQAQLFADEEAQLHEQLLMIEQIALRQNEREREARRKAWLLNIFLNGPPAVGEKPCATTKMIRAKQAQLFADKESQLHDQLLMIEQIALQRNEREREARRQQQQEQEARRKADEHQEAELKAWQQIAEIKSQQQKSEQQQQAEIKVQQQKQAEIKAHQQKIAEIKAHQKRWELCKNMPSEKLEAIERKLDMIRQQLGASRKVDNTAGIATLRAAVAA